MQGVEWNGAEYNECEAEEEELDFAPPPPIPFQFYQYFFNLLNLWISGPISAGPKVFTDIIMDV